MFSISEDPIILIAFLWWDIKMLTSTQLHNTYGLPAEGHRASVWYSQWPLNFYLSGWVTLATHGVWVHSPPRNCTLRCAWGFQDRMQTSIQTMKVRLHSVNKCACSGWLLRIRTSLEQVFSKRAVTCTSLGRVSNGHCEFAPMFLLTCCEINPYFHSCHICYGT